LLHARKKLSSQALPLVLAAICVSSIAFQLVSHAGFTAAGHGILMVAILLFAMLMLFMGGRLIAPTIAGQLYRQEGGKLNARIQPRIEGSLLVAMTVAATASVFAGEPPYVALAAAATILAGVLSMVRLLRWRLWELGGRPDLLCLAAGYGWLAVGLFLYGTSLAAGRYQTAALHVITIGALGTLTLNVIVMTWTLKARQDPARARAPVWATLLIGAATLARALASLGVYDPLVLLQLAAACWSGAFVLLLIRLVHIRLRRDGAQPVF
jgi:uncharacterized protein involved in response to NO